MTAFTPPAGPQGPQGPPGQPILIAQFQRTTDFTIATNTETMVLTTGLLNYSANRCYEIRASVEVWCTTTAARVLARILNVQDGQRVNLVDTILPTQNVRTRYNAPFIYRPGAADTSREFQITAQAATNVQIGVGGPAPAGALLQVWDYGLGF